MPPQKMGPLRYIIRQLSWCEGKSVLLTALWVKVKVIDYEGADVVVGRFSRYPAQRLMDMYCKEHVFDQELRTARAALRTESRESPSPPAETICECEDSAYAARATVPTMPLQPKDHVSITNGDHCEQDIVEAFVGLAARSTPDELAESEEAFALVARSVTKKEVRENIDADAACKTEWERLGTIGCWDLTSVDEWKKVRATAPSTIHIGALHELCTEKGSELPVGHKDRKFKGRVVFLGDRVRDQCGKVAVFEEMTSNPASMEAGKLTDLFGCLRMYNEHVGPLPCGPTGTAGGESASAAKKTKSTKPAKRGSSGSVVGGGSQTVPFVLQQSDATQAYCQAELGGPDTWIRLPKSRWPPGWEGKYTDPVCKLRLALYGHPNSGSYWEVKCESKFLREGFRRVGDAGEWRSCYVHDGLGVICIVYVDDFKMGGPPDAVTEAWKLLRNGEGSITMDDPKPLSQYLGCEHKLKSHTLADGTVITRVEYDMEQFLRQCVDAYKALSGVDKLEVVTTPFIAEDDYGNVSRRPASDGNGLCCPWCEGVYPTEEFVPWKPGKGKQYQSQPGSHRRSVQKAMRVC